MPINPLGGTLRVEINHMDATGLPAALVGDNNDHRILAVAKNLANEAHSVVVVTKDLPLRLKASIVGLDAEEYRNELAGDATWTGFVELDVDSESIDQLFAELSEKAVTRPAGSGTVAELDSGVHGIGKKIVEEAAEVWMAAEHESDERAAEEISQLLYHLQVLVIARGLTLEDVYKHL